MKWTDKEDGPECFCGMPTFVIVDESGTAGLICILHEGANGALFPLPNERPETWPNLSIDDLDALMLKGQDEHDVREAEKEHEKNKLSLS